MAAQIEHWPGIPMAAHLRPSGYSKSYDLWPAFALSNFFVRDDSLLCR